MAEITAAAVKELREKSGAGMMDCKKALTETNGDIEAATDWLRTKGLAAAAKKSSRTAAEGLVGLAVAGTKGVAVEVNSQTDFVAKNDIFQTFVRDVTAVALELGDDIEVIKAAPLPAGTVEEVLTNNISTIGENQVLRRAKQVQVSQGAVIPYVHNAQAPGLGKIGVLVALESDAGVDVLEPLGKQIAMHVAAAFPLALSVEDLDPEVVEREAAILREKNAEKIVGKSAEVAEKILNGPIEKFKKENALLTQLFVMDGKTPVQDVIAKAAKDAGASIVLKDYVRFQLGEGIEKEESDFAAEVAATAGLTN
ncbi:MULTISPECIES: translation elongation factor Ts [unclassified Sphingomonas]|uniref:translation elongation factor Ts n=1 Tax=unclassified Sphingomonas TaxID=196159 RepID=UPI0022B4D9C2|nr:translation elongation factor Ts [Sphingomonas sp. NIBR02145]WHU03993.1 translation elongation factor Ts [Sphingomonas sp. NIBR02145]